VAAAVRVGVTGVAVRAVVGPVVTVAVAVAVRVGRVRGASSAVPRAPGMGRMVAVAA